MVLDASAPNATDETPAGLVEVGAYATFAEGSEHGLVVLAMGLPYWLEPAGDRFALRVEPAASDEVRDQLARFDRESAGWPPPPIDPAGGRPADLVTPLLWMLIALAAFRAQQLRPGWTRAGALDPVEIFGRGEWWRPGTALFLHADVGHFVSNLLGGAFVFGAVTTTMGRRRGWLFIALAAVAGNLLSALLRSPADYLSLGASTGIFGGVGLLAGRALRMAAGAAGPRRGRAMFVPLAAGFIVLALYGAGGVRIDVGAHLCGFACGAVLGAAAGSGSRHRRSCTSVETSPDSPVAGRSGG